MYSRWRKIKGSDKDNPVENKAQMQSSFKEFEKKLNEDDMDFPKEELESPHY